MSGSSLALLAAEGDQGAPLWLWLVTVLAAPVLIAIDLFLVGRIHPRFTPKTAFVWTTIWFVIGLAFAIPVANAAGSDYGIKYSTGYLLEKALTIDQVVVIALIIRTYRTPTELGRKLVFIALCILLFMRMPFIALGYILAEDDRLILHAVMAGLFVIGGFVLLRARFEEHDPKKQYAVRALTKFRPVVEEYDGDAMVVHRDGKKAFTLAAVTMTALLTADLYFDSTVPLAFAFTKPPYIVLASSTLAMLGLRSMYAFVSAIHMDVVMLKVSLALALWLVALDLLVAGFVEHPRWAIPALVFLVVLAPLVVSWRRTDAETRDAHAAHAFPEDFTGI